jgi:hypothetical protein
MAMLRVEFRRIAEKAKGEIKASETESNIPAARNVTGMFFILYFRE